MLSRLRWCALFGAALAVLEYLYYLPLMPAPQQVGLAPLAASLVNNAIEAVLLGLVVTGAERRVGRDLRARELATALIVGAAFSVAVWQSFAHYVLREQFGVPLFADYVGQPTTLGGVVLYRGWLMLFFGGLAAGVYASQRWRQRMLDSLRSAELGRARSERTLAQARLDALRSRLDPEMVFRRLETLERLYETDLEAAERLLDELVAELRAAVTDIRSAMQPPLAVIA